MPHTSQGSDRLGALAGLAFALLFFFSVFVVDPLRGATDQEVQEWWTDGGMRRDAIISMALMLLAGPCFLVFASRLRARLRESNTEGTGHDVVFGAGMIFVAMLTLTAIVRGVIAQAVRFGDEPLPGLDTLRFATSLSDAAFGLGAMPFVTLAVAAASVVILQTGAMPRWVGWFGLGVTTLSAIAIAMLIGPFAIPLTVLWVFSVSYQFFRSRSSHMAAASTRQPAVPEQVQPLAGRAQ